MINIRIARPSEFEDVEDFIRSIFPNATMEIGDEDIVLVAEERDRMVGFAHIVDDGEHLILKGIGVVESMRGRGVGTLLLAHLIEMVKDDTRPMFLKVKSTNPAVDLYSRYGFFLKKFGPTSVLVRKHNC